MESAVRFLLSNGLARMWKETLLSNFRLYPGIHLEGLRKTTKILIQDSLSPNWYLNPWTPEYEFGRDERMYLEDHRKTGRAIARITYNPGTCKHRSHSFSAPVEGYNMYFKDTIMLYCAWIAYSPTRRWSVRGWNTSNLFTSWSDVKCQFSILVALFSQVHEHPRKAEADAKSHRGITKRSVCFPEPWGWAQRTPPTQRSRRGDRERGTGRLTVIYIERERERKQEGSKNRERRQKERQHRTWKQHKKVDKY
jgi:hypothetical protein